MAITDDQQFCLRWNNFQANITSQFETLRDDEDFVDVTLACQGQKLEAHKVVLSACSPFFKELFKSNPCPHPIIFMRDVEARHVAALLEFMYAGEVNVCRTQLSDFLRTAESLQIRGLSDASKVQRDEELKVQLQKENEFLKRQYGSETLQINDKKSPKSPNSNSTSTKSQNVSLQSKKSQSPDCISRSQSPNLQGNKTQFQKHVEADRRLEQQSNARSPVSTPPPTKRKCKTEFDMIDENELNKGRMESSPSPASTGSNIFANINASHLNCELDLPGDIIEPKTEPDYASDDDQVMRSDSRMDEALLGFEGSDLGSSFVKLHGGMEIGPGTSMGEISQDSNQALSESRKLHSLDPRPCHLCGRVYSNLSNLRQHMRLIHHPQTVICPICSKQFKTDLYMKRHLLLYHNESSSVVEHRGTTQPLQQDNVFFNSEEMEHRDLEKDSSFICFESSQIESSYHSLDATIINQI